MNSKHLIVVSLLLAIVTMGVVSASENATADYVLTANDTAEDSLEQSPAADAIRQSEDLKASPELEPTDFNVEIRDFIDLDDENDQVVVNYTVPEGADGRVDVYVDFMDTPSYSNVTVVGQTVNITAANLNINVPLDYHITVEYVPTSGDSMILSQHTVKAYVYTDKDFSIFYDSWISSKNENIVSYFSYPIAGTLALYVDGTPRCTRDLKDLYENVYVYLSDLAITADGTYNVSAKYTVATTGKEIELDNETVKVDGVDWDIDEYVFIFPSADILKHDDYFIEIENNGEYVNGTLSVYVDGTLKLNRSITSDDELLYYDVDIDSLGLYDNIALGEHNVTAIYMKDNKQRHAVETPVEFYANPIFIRDFIVSVYEKDVLKVTYLKGFKGTATLYNAIRQQSSFDPEIYYLEKQDIYKSADFANGIATIPFDSMSEGEHAFILNITEIDAEYHIYVTSKRNSEGYLAEVSSSEITVGDSVTVKFSGPKSDDIVSIYLDDKEFRYLPLTSGSTSETVEGLTVGTHRFKFVYDDGERFYSNTLYVNVKDVPGSAPTPAPAKKADKITLSLKKVKVKKSAKKLVLKATLKINGKKVKGKVIKFKFKGKTYKAKTNKKGIAKVTIKKKILKKLKVGKKVKYQATYGKVTKKYTVKVKK